MARKIISLLFSIAFAGGVSAHQISFNSSMTYSGVQPGGDAGSVANWTGAAFDAANIGGTGVNADGAPNNGTANDAYTYVADNQPVQGQTFLTGSHANGYQLNAITVRMAGYTSNNASGGNVVYWNLNELNGPIILTICAIEGTNRTVQTMQNFKAGEVDNPGSGGSANGPGTYITFHMPFTTYLQPDTVYGFELQIGNGSDNYFEWLGTSDTNAYANGTAYHPSGSTITPTSGDHVFLADMTELAAPVAGFVHPGALHTQTEIDLMKAKITASEEPWLSGYNMLLSSPYNNLGWPAYDVDYIIRGGTGDNYTRCQQDAQLIYTLTLIWKLTGNTAYADRAVQIANVWSDLLGIQGDSNRSLAAGICGYLFASAGELLSTYSGWAAADQQAYKEMMMRVFYPENFDFLWRHHDTFFNEGGNTHYRLNWDTANMASLAAIGILCDNRAVYAQAVDYFKYGPGNGNVRRAAWYLHPGGLGQGEEAGRDQGHNLAGWYQMALLCQMAWNQGDDLFGYDNNRVLRAFEYNAKYNLGNDDVPYARHRNSDLSYTEGSVSSAGRGFSQYYQYELVYNHYRNSVGIAAPWSEQAAEAARPEPWPDTSIHPSQVDWFGLGTLTFSREATTSDVAPSGLRANWSKNNVIVDWWGSARATGYLVKRATAEGGPYTQIGTVAGPDLNFTDVNVTNDTVYYYIVTAQTPAGDLDSDPLRVAQELATLYSFEGSTTNDVAGGGDATPHGGSTGLPGYSTGFGGGQAIDLDGVDDFVQLPVDAANFQDITVATWARWDGGNAWQRIFDFGSEIEKSMFLTTKNGSGVIEWSFTSTRGGNVVGDASYYLTGPAMPLGTWTHLAVTLNGDVMTLYVNGIPVDTGVNDLIDPLNGQPFCYIGKSMWNADPLFNGRIDDFRIYNHALSGNEIYDLWGQSGGNHAPVFDADPIELAPVEYGVALSGQTLAGRATDSDGDGLTYSKIAPASSWLSVASSGALSGTPTLEDAGENIFFVRVTDTSGASDDAILRIPVADSDPPAAPTSLIAGSEAGYVPLSWTMNSEPDLAYYTVYRSTTSGSGYGVIASGVATNVYDDSAVVEGTTYYYLVTATDTSNNESDQSSEASATPLVEITLANAGFELPAAGKISDGFDGSTDVPGWNDFGTMSDSGIEAASFGGHSGTYSAYLHSGDGGAYQMTGYMIHEGAVFTLGYWAKIDWTDSTCAMTGVLFWDTPNSVPNEIGRYAADPLGNEWTYYECTVTATVESVGHELGIAFINTQTDWAALDDVTLYVSAEPNPPNAPTGLAAVSGDAQISLSWDAVADATSYNVKRSLISGSEYGIKNSTANTNYVDVGLTNGTVYYYVVSAVGLGGEGINSMEVSAVPSVAVSSNEFHIVSHVVDGGTNLMLTVSNSVLGHLYGLLATDSLLPPAWSNILVEAGTGSNLLFGISIDPASTNRFFKLDVQRQ